MYKYFFVQDNTTVDEWMLRKLSRIMTERAKSQSIASSKVYFSTFINSHSLIVPFYSRFQIRVSQNVQIEINSPTSLI